MSEILNEVNPVMQEELNDLTLNWIKDKQNVQTKAPFVKRWLYGVPSRLVLKDATLALSCDHHETFI